MAGGRKTGRPLFSNSNQLNLILKPSSGLFSLSLSLSLSFSLLYMFFLSFHKQHINSAEDIHRKNTRVPKL